MPAALQTPTARAIRVMVVDDSAVARAMTATWLREQPDFEVVAECRTGRAALDAIERAAPDVVVLDIEMPDMDGIEALPLLLRARPGLAVLMASSFTTRGADLSLRCLALGAMDVVAKPTTRANPDDYRREIIAKARALGGVSGRRGGARHASAQPTLAPAFTAMRRASAQAADTGPVSAIAIGASTGGPQALGRVMRALKPAIAGVPVFVVQHMPAGFTQALASHLSSGCGIVAREAVDGEEARGGVVYVAPGGKHMSVVQKGAARAINVYDGPAVNYCKPSVDPLFRSAAEAYRAGLVAVVLTGMGSDGAAAAQQVARNGGRVVAQDEATSVVWGMPGATVATGCCEAVLPVDDIGPHLVRLMKAGASA